MMNAKKALQKSMLNRECRAICKLKDAIKTIERAAERGEVECRMGIGSYSDEFVIRKLKELGYTVTFGEGVLGGYINITWINSK